MPVSGLFSMKRVVVTKRPQAPRISSMAAPSEGVEPLPLAAGEELTALSLEAQLLCADAPVAAAARRPVSAVISWEYHCMEDSSKRKQQHGSKGATVEHAGYGDGVLEALGEQPNTLSIRLQKEHSARLFQASDWQLLVRSSPRLTFCVLVGLCVCLCACVPVACVPVSQWCVCCVRMCVYDP